MFPMCATGKVDIKLYCSKFVTLVFHSIAERAFAQEFFTMSFPECLPRLLAPEMIDRLNAELELLGTLDRPYPSAGAAAAGLALEEENLGR